MPRPPPWPASPRRWPRAPWAAWAAPAPVSERDEQKTGEGLGAHLSRARIRPGKRRRPAPAHVAACTRLTPACTCAGNPRQASATSSCAAMWWTWCAGLARACRAAAAPPAAAAAAAENAARRLAAAGDAAHLARLPTRPPARPAPCRAVLQAIGIVIGGAFTSLVNAFVSDFITPLIAAIWGGADFSALAFYVNGSKFSYGARRDRVARPQRLGWRGGGHGMHGSKRGVHARLPAPQPKMWGRRRTLWILGPIGPKSTSFLSRFVALGRPCTRTARVKAPKGSRGPNCWAARAAGSRAAGKPVL